MGEPPRVMVGHLAEVACEEALRDAQAPTRERKESLQLRLWNLNFTSNSGISCGSPSTELSDFRQSVGAETSTNVNKHWKTRAKGNDVITSVVSANQRLGK